MAHTLSKVNFQESWLKPPGYTQMREREKETKNRECKDPKVTMVG